MKSKTSCFNRTIFKKNFSHYWPLWVFYLCYMMAVLPGKLWLCSKQIYYENMPQIAKQYQIMSDVLTSAIKPLPVFLFAAVMTMAFFNYLYAARSANMIHALPVNRLELFLTNFVSGLGFLIIPELLAFVVAVLVCLSAQITCIQFLFWWLLNMLGITLFAFSAAVFVAMFTGNLLAMPVYYFVMNYLYVGCYYLISQLIAAISYGASSAWNPGSSCILSPIYYIGNNVRIQGDYEEKTGYLAGLHIVGYKLVILYAVVGVVLAVAAYRLYRRRRIETAGDLVSVEFLKPVFRWGVAICGGVALSHILNQMVEGYVEINSFACILVCFLVFGTICFFAAEALLQKSLRIWKKKRLLEWAVCMAVAVLGILLVRLDAFGIERRIPVTGEVEQAFVYMDYPVAVEDTKDAIAIQQRLIEYKDAYKNLSARDENNASVTLRYYKKDGTIFERQYVVPLTEEALQDETSPASMIRSLECRPEYVRDQVFNSLGENGSYYSGYVERYNDSGTANNYALHSDELKVLLEAVNKDIEAGNFRDYLLYTPNQKEGSYWNSICLEFSGGTGFYSSWDYFANYLTYQSNGSAREYSVGGSSYFSFGPKCVFTVDALYELGVFDDEWKLYTVDEYEKIMNY
ncbi:MAG: ABC transporter permease [Roseburia sp.]